MPGQMTKSSTKFQVSKLIYSIIQYLQFIKTHKSGINQPQNQIEFGTMPGGCKI